MIEATTAVGENNIGAGFQLTDGTNYAYIGAYGTGYVYNDFQNNYEGGFVSAASDCAWVLNGYKNIPVKFAIVKLGNNVDVYMNDELVDSVSWELVAPGFGADTDVAIGLLMLGDPSSGNGELKFEDYDIEIGTQAAKAYHRGGTQFQNTVYLDQSTSNAVRDVKKVTSQNVFWDLTNEANGVIQANAGGKTIFFPRPASDFVVEYTATNLSTANAMLAAFQFTDGDTSLGSRWIGAYGTGYKTSSTDDYEDSGFLGTYGLAPANHTWFLTKDKKLPLRVAVIKEGDTLYLYMNNTLVGQKDWGYIMGDEDYPADRKVAVGMYLDQVGKVENFKYLTGQDAIDDYRNGMFRDTFYSENTEYVYGQARDNWDLTNAADKVISTSSSYRPIFFPQVTSGDFVAEFTATNETVAGQGDANLGAGFWFTNGSTHGYIDAYGAGYRINGTYTGGLVSTYGVSTSTYILSNGTNGSEKAPLKFTVVKKDTKLYIYMNDIQVNVVDWTTVSNGISATANISVGMYLNSAGTKPTVEIKDYSLITGTAAADAYMNRDRGFQETVLVNGKQVTSNIAAWDLTNEENKVITTTAQSKPIYYGTTGTDFVAEFTATNTSTDTTADNTILAGFQLTDGSNYNWIGAFGTGYKYIGGYVGSKVTGLSSNWILYKGSNEPAKFAIAKKGSTVNVYINDYLVDTANWSTIAPDIASTSQVAVGIFLGAGANGTLSIEVKDYSLAVGTSSVDAYIAKKANSNIVTYNSWYYATMLSEGKEIQKSDSWWQELGTVTKTSDTTVFIGDSFFDRREFWTDFYTDDYAGKDVFLAGIGGTRADQWTNKLLDTVLDYPEGNQPKNIVMHLGTNDVGAGDSVDTVKTELQALLNKIHTQYPNTNIYYFGITKRYDNEAFNDVITGVNGAMSEWCSSAGYVTYIDTPSIITQDMLKEDGLHPKLETYSQFVNKLNEVNCVIVNK